MNNIFFAYINRMKYINRWGLMRNTDTENIQEHSLQVAILAHALCIIKNKYFGGNINADRSCVYALYHDANEIITGDLPTPVKYFNPQIKESYRKIEDISKEKLVSMLPDDMQDEYRSILFYEEDEEYRDIIRAADKLSAYIKCVEEVKAGNKEFLQAKESIYNVLVDMNLPELEYFMEHFLPSYSLSLDEMN
ncbi:MAG TPA: 5'-deoxynucleotidase [Clostridiaceae bacterium]|nr:5'-deoxynucleotidase [Clostridiaceae bacterium]